MATWSNLNLQDRNSPLIEQLIFFHDHAILILIIITILVGYLIIILFFNKLTNRFLLHGQIIEIIWTILPAIILLFIALPSLRLLYLIEEFDESKLTVKSIGHQWFWSYEYTSFLNIVDFSSYIKPYEDLEINTFRLLDVDNRLILPIKCNIRILVTASDVLHSWTIPSLGVKVDATPGRLNQTSFKILRPGIYFGQCSEICGANHSFIPIIIEVLSPWKFREWAWKIINN